MTWKQWEEFETQHFTNRPIAKLSDESSIPVPNFIWRRNLVTTCTYFSFFIASASCSCPRTDAWISFSILSPSVSATGAVRNARRPSAGRLDITSCTVILRTKLFHTWQNKSSQWNLVNSVTHQNRSSQWNLVNSVTHQNRSLQWNFVNSVTHQNRSLQWKIFGSHAETALYRTAL